jgi:formylmethanofuran dehydrogenase subunit E
MYGFTDDPVADHMRHEVAREEALASLPKCSCCKEPIQDDELYDFEGKLVCEECMIDYVFKKYRKQTCDYIT